MAQGARRKKSRGASPQRKRSHSAPGSPLRWFMSGLFAGVLGCTILWLMVQQPDAPQRQQPQARTQTEAEANSKDEHETQFDFFTLLPEREISISPEELEAQNQLPQESVSYTLQAGSFRRSEDADRRRARLILLGLDARVDAINNTGDTWHRVYVGPFTSRSEMASARNLMISEGIETLLLKQRQ